MCGRSLFTGVRAQTHFGRPDFDKILDAIHARHPKVSEKHTLTIICNLDKRAETVAVRRSD